MEIWIRSQDRLKFLPNPKLLAQYDCGNNNIIDLETGAIFGTYETRQRTLEVLDEIQNKMKERYIAQEKSFFHPDDEEAIKQNFLKHYNIEVILTPPTLEFAPVNKGIMVYEMPEE